jgi:GT2 family glycosyltransferase
LTTYPLVSIIILNYNGIQYIDNCLRSVLNTNYPNLEVIFVDNASTDGSLQYAQSIYSTNSQLKFVVNNINFGFAEGNNLGARHAHGSYLIFLNNDTVVDPNWISEISVIFTHNSFVGAVQSLLLHMDSPNKIQSAGMFMLRFLGYTWDWHLNEDIDSICWSAHDLTNIGIAQGAALAIRKELINKIGLFDKEFGAYFEDTDLCWRIWLAGFKIVLAPYSKVYHMGSKSYKRSNAKVRSYLDFNQPKNCIRLLLKNYSFGNVIRYTPVVILNLYIASLFTLIVYKKNSRVINLSRGIWWNLRNLKTTLQERAKVQNYVRKVPDSEVTKYLMRDLSFSILFKRSFSMLKGSIGANSS